MFARIAAVLALGVGLMWSAQANAQDTIKIGLIMAYSGPFADTANQMQAGIDLYMQQHGDEVAGKKIEIIKKDTGGPKADEAKRLAQELIVRDGVDILAGFTLTPEALGAAAVADQAKKFMVVMNAATSIITEKSPYIVRTSMTIPQLNTAFGKWAYEKGGVKQAYTLVADYAPGVDASTAFAKGFTDAGGTIVGADKSPMGPPDFSAFVQRIKDASPEAVFVFIPGGAQPPALGKALAERGLTPPNTQIFAQGELTFPEAIKSMGDTAKGIITTFNYTMERDDPINNAFVKAYRDANKGRSPDIYSVGGYDGMHLIYEALKKTGGSTDAAALVKASEGMSWESPRGKMVIDPETRDVIQTVYIRKVEEVDGQLQNVVIDEIPDVKDPLHGAK
ncbi:MAG: ABC transporter substrate-binding protein [Salaquimonas sp.]|jgi:branched-chain amino acid transport system substrate-binding protein|nr:ABC transporter substrate-binding protein [Salaquimonas sp.]